MAYTYDVFLSYASQDRPWAERLDRGLGDRNVKVFFDRKSLRDGEGWEDQLTAALKASRHLICLWSAHAQASAWVSLETYSFRAWRSPQTPGARCKLLALPLDDQRHVFGSQQCILVDPLLKAYRAQRDDPDGMRADDWSALLDRIAGDVQDDGGSIRIPVILFTLTRQQFDATPLNPAKLPVPVALQGGLCDRYGDRWTDWRPFGRGDSIRALLARVEADLNAKLKPRGLRIVWRLPDEQLLCRLQTAREIASQIMESGIGLLLIDPIALYNTDVVTRLGVFQRCINYENVAIMSFPLSSPDDMALLLRQDLEDRASALINSYIDPPLEARAELPMARVALDAARPEEVRQVLQLALGRHLKKDRPASASPFTTVPDGDR